MLLIHKMYHPGYTQWNKAETLEEIYSRIDWLVDQYATETIEIDESIHCVVPFWYKGHHSTLSIVYQNQMPKYILLVEKDRLGELPAPDFSYSCLTIAIGMVSSIESVLFGDDETCMIPDTHRGTWIMELADTIIKNIGCSGAHIYDASTIDVRIIDHPFRADHSSRLRVYPGGVHQGEPGYQCAALGNDNTMIEFPMYRAFQGKDSWYCNFGFVHQDGYEGWDSWIQYNRRVYADDILQATDIVPSVEPLVNEVLGDYMLRLVELGYVYTYDTILRSIDKLLIPPSNTQLSKLVQRSRFLEKYY